MYSYFIRELIEFHTRLSHLSCMHVNISLCELVDMASWLCRCQFVPPKLLVILWKAVWRSTRFISALDWRLSAVNLRWSRLMRTRTTNMHRNRNGLCHSLQTARWIFKSNVFGDAILVAIILCIRWLLHRNPIIVSRPSSSFSAWHWKT